VSGTPKLALTIGAATRQAAYVSSPAGFGGRFLLFSYTVQAADRDTDGISIPANALTLNGGTIRDAGGNNAVLSPGSSFINYLESYAADRKVDGSIDRAPSVTNLLLDSPQSGDTYGVSEPIWIRLRFDENVTATGTPQVALTIGAQARQATYVRSPGAGPFLSFRYIVQAADRDADGISIVADGLTLNGGIIQDDGGNAALLSLSGHTVANDVAHKVDGSIDRAPSATGCPCPPTRRVGTRSARGRRSR